QVPSYGSTVRRLYEGCVPQAIRLMLKRARPEVKTQRPSFRRLAFARSSEIERPAVSSMSREDSASFPAAAVSEGKSRSLRNPFRTFCRFTFALEHSRR